MDTENIKDSTTGGEKSETPIGKSETAADSTSESRKISPSELAKETIAKESRENQGDPRQMPQQPQQPQPLNIAQNPNEAQGWIGILWQSVKNVRTAGVDTFITTKWKDGVPMLVIMAYPAFCCDSCHEFNHGTKCQNDKCDKFGVEIKP